MTISFNAVRVILYNWATANVPAGMPVIMLNQNAPQPTNNGIPLDYVTIYITSVVQIGRDWTQEPLSNDGISNMVGDREFTLQLMAYGGDPLTVLENLRTSLQAQPVLANLATQGLVYVDWYPIVDVTEVIDSRFQNRGSWDSRWRLSQNYTENIGVISSTVVTGTVFEPTGTVAFTENFTIPQP